MLFVVVAKTIFSLHLGSQRTLNRRNDSLFVVLIAGLLIKAERRADVTYPITMYGPVPLGSTPCSLSHCSSLVLCKEERESWKPALSYIHRRKVTGRSYLASRSRLPIR